MIPKNKIKLKREQETPLLKTIKDKFNERNIEEAVMIDFTSDFRNFRHGITYNKIEDFQYDLDFRILLSTFYLSKDEIKRYLENNDYVQEFPVYDIWGENGEMDKESLQTYLEDFNNPESHLIFYKGNYFIRNDLLESYLKQIN